VPAILGISQQMPSGAQLLFDPLHGYGWKDRGGWEVYLGSIEEMHTKLLVYEAIRKHIKKTDARPSLISVELAHAPYYRLEP